MLRGLLAKFGRKADPPAAEPLVTAVPESGHRPRAAELNAEAARHRQRGEHADAESSLLRAIELDHGNGEAHHNLGLLYLEQGNAEDAVDCLQLAVHFSPRLAAAHADLGGALFALRRYEAAEEACRRALELDPASAVTCLLLGNVLKARGDLVHAAAAYRAALEHDADNRNATCQLAFVLFRLGQYDESRQTYATLIESQPDFAEAHHNLGLLQLETGYPREALESFRQALALKPDTIEILSSIAHALRDLGRLDDAIAAYDAALSLDPRFDDAITNRCYALLMRGDYAAGWAEYEQRFPASERPLRGFPFQSWCGEPLAGKRILVFAEQGIGDEIMFASCLPELLHVAGNCVIECNSRLAPLFRRSFPTALVHGANKSDDKGWLKELPRVDYQVAIGSLPLHFRRTRESFPSHRGYLKADPQRVEFWNRTLGSASKPARVGISWRGGSLATRQFLRSTRLSDWLPVVGQQNFEFISLQYGNVGQELSDLRAHSGISVRDLGAAAADLDELAAAISALDLVISVDNTVVHLAGALGKPVWVLLPFASESRYLRDGDRMPWYPSARLFRQANPVTGPQCWRTWLTPSKRS